MGRPYEATTDFVVDNTSVLYAMDYPTRVAISKIRITGTKSAQFNVTVYARALAPLAPPIVGIFNDQDKTIVEFMTPPGFVVGDKFVVAGNKAAGGSDSGYNVAHTVTQAITVNSVVTDQAYAADGQGGHATPALHLTGVTTTKGGNFSPAAGPSLPDDGSWGFCVLMFATPHGLQVDDVIAVTQDVGPTNSTSAYDTPPHPAHTVTQVIDRYTVVTNRKYVGDGTGGLAVLTIPAAMYPNYEVIAKTASGNGSPDYAYRYDEPHGRPYVCRDPDVNHMPVRKIYFLFDTQDNYRVTVTSLTDWYG